MVAWYGTDQLGSVRMVFDNSGTVTGQRSYSGFGEIVSETGTGLDRYAFTAREWDSAIGLQYSRARMYDPAVGRWMSEDPIGFAAGDANLHRYVGNAATLARDPSGLCDWPTLGRIAAASLPLLPGLTDRVLETIGIAESVNPSLGNTPGTLIAKEVIPVTGPLIETSIDIVGKASSGRLEEAAASAVSAGAGTLSGSVILTAPVAIEDAIAAMLGVDPDLMRLFPSQERQAIEEVTVIGNALDPVNTERGRRFAPIVDFVLTTILFGGLGGGAGVARGTAAGIAEETLPAIRAGLRTIRPTRPPVTIKPPIQPRIPTKEPLGIKPRLDLQDAAKAVGDPIHPAYTDPLNATKVAQVKPGVSPMRGVSPENYPIVRDVINGNRPHTDLTALPVAERRAAIDFYRTVEETGVASNRDPVRRQVQAAFNKARADFLERGGTAPGNFNDWVLNNYPATWVRDNLPQVWRAFLEGR